MAFSRAASEEPFVLANSTQTTHPTDLHRKEAHTLGLHQREHTHTHTLMDMRTDVNAVPHAGLRNPNPERSRKALKNLGVCKRK